MLWLGLVPAWSGEFQSAWENESGRVWLGDEYWAERLADWRLREGQAECVALSGDGALRSVRVLTQRLGEGPGGFVIELTFRANGSHPVAAGISVGEGADGWSMGCGLDGKLFLGTMPTTAAASLTGVRKLRIEGIEEGGALTVRGTLSDEAGAKLSELAETLDESRLSGPIAFFATGGTMISALRMVGARIVTDPKAHFGPIAGALHTLSRGVLKVTAQLLPVGPDDPDRVFLETARQGVWETIGESVIETPGWTATFRVPNWRETEDVAYRLVYGEHTWGGTIRRNPVDRHDLNVAVLADSAKLVTGGAPVPSVAATELSNGVLAAKPDLLFFPGRQVDKPAGVLSGDAATLTLDYLQGWYQWHTTFRNLTRDLPCVTMPGATDVFQDALWGEGGRPTLNEAFGGYRRPAAFLQVVQRTQASHLPDPVDPVPALQGLAVCFTELNYGRIGFALIEDHKWKSGCQGIGLPLPADGRPELVQDEKIDPRQLDLPGLKLWGDRQIAFLEKWAADWNATDFKVALSGAVLAQLATNQGMDLTAAGADLSSNGWPQSGRKKALEVLRKAGAIHVAADGGLASVVRHGIETHDDAVYSFAVPSVRPTMGRSWKPRSSGGARESGQPFWMGQHVDGLRNPVTVVAASQPAPDGSLPGGFAMVRFDRGSREIRFEALGKGTDAAGEAWVPLDGWPVVVAQENNFAGPPRSWLPPLQVSGIAKPVVQVWNVADRSLVYARRLREPAFTPWVLEPGRYDVRIGDPDTGLWIDLKGVEAAEEPYRETRVIEF